MGNYAPSAARPKQSRSFPDSLSEFSVPLLPECRHYSAQGKLLTPLSQKQIKAVEKTFRGKVQKPTFPLNLQIPHTTRDSHFPTASTTTTE